MIGTIPTDLKSQSDYQPGEAVVKLTNRIKQDYQVGYDIQRRTYREFNDVSFLTRLDLDQQAFNAYVPPKSTDPDESWRENGVRPVTRNKIISIVAHMAANLMYPNAFAQNEHDEEDKDAALIMRDMLEWNIENGDYDTSMFFTLIAAAVNPVAYLGVEFVEAMQTIKRKSKNGELTKEEVVDDVISGMQFPVIPPDEIFISNAYQFHHQRQRFTARRRLIDMDEAEARYGEHKFFKYVTPGVKNVMDADNGTFYRVIDAENPTLVEEFTYRNRREDLEVCFVNGVYMGDDNTEANPMYHRDTEGKPRYPEAKTGYEPIDGGRFYFYKSAAFKLASEQTRVDKMHRMVMDGTHLAVMPPIITSGGVKVDASVVFPRAVTNMPKDATITPLSIGSSLTAGYNAIADAERQMSESSQDPIRGGATPQGDRTAYEIARIEQNAVIKEFGIFGRMIGDLVEQVGDLMVDNIINFQTLGEVMEVTSGGAAMKFQNFLLSDQTESGKKVTKKISFSDKYMGRPMTEEQRKAEGYKIIDLEGGLDAETRIYFVNPALFAKMKYKVIISPDSMIPRSKLFEEEKKLRGYGLMIASPYADQEAVTRDYLFDIFASGETDKYMRKATDILGMQSGAPGQPMTPGAGAIPGPVNPLANVGGPKTSTELPTAKAGSMPMA